MEASSNKIPRPAKLSDIAKLAGCSASAVSSVLNNTSIAIRFLAETRRRIFEAARFLNYRPNAAARALSAGRMNIIGVPALVNKGDNYTYLWEVFNGIIEAADEFHQQATIFPLKNWEDGGPCLPSFLDGRIDGLLLISPILSPEDAQQLPASSPIVAVQSNTPLPNVFNVDCNDGHGAHLLMKHLLSCGHRRIVHLGGTRWHVSAVTRFNSYRRALEEAGIAFDPALVYYAGYSPDYQRESLREYLRQLWAQHPPEAIFCANDAIALTTIRLLNSMSIAVPHEVSVAGFDDTISAAIMNPPLTTVRQPLRAMGFHALAHLIHQIETKLQPMPNSSLVLPTELIIRSSVIPRAESAQIKKPKSPRKPRRVR